MCGYRFNGILALHLAEPVGTRIELPKFGDQNGALRPAIVLPEEIRGPIGDAVPDELVERGLARRRFAAPMRAG